ncbi:flagellar biosynthesis protein FlhF [Lysinibacillus sp. 2017]|uniref:flagellar biosynthesis protein FlhF n=1 Tax=unclassified Lysinibacillus TaxID=2636778 RepID=UPI000D52A748|nr:MULTISPECIES: flagellar biosynthesis protein FlhF [unclassified Lysinibacillus]AWE06693.1 flagellar biosynthesis protein FlhF [Lysinibacillus sp. 2017]TGN37375.1 flagellar biosynthesis protein FlhF [Lysinibacillus sp. S2017]
MKMKKYNAPSIAEAMKLIRADLGDDAVILNSKVVITKKFLGLVKNKSYEVVAGYERVEKKPSLPSLQDISSITKTINKEPVKFQNQPMYQSVEPVMVPQADQSDTLVKEIADLKSMMQAMQRMSTQSLYPDELLPFVDSLKQQELGEELVTAISDELFVHFKNGGHPLHWTDMQKVAKNYLKNQLKDLPIDGLSYEKKYINVLGPTGVGKTTTIAKMAARSVLEKKKKIGFITTDTYRIAAIEQLKTYAALLQAPVEIVYSAKDYEEAIKKLSYLDLIFIDTAGRNYKEAKYVEDLQALINFNEDVESYLVLALTAKQKDLESIIEQFKELKIEKFIFTKLDETNSIGTMFNLMIKYKKGLAYYTNGQEVPEDIEQPSIESLLELFFKENLDERSS